MRTRKFILERACKIGILNLESKKSNTIEFAAFDKVRKGEGWQKTVLCVRMVTINCMLACSG